MQHVNLTAFKTTSQLLKIGFVNFQRELRSFHFYGREITLFIVSVMV